MRVVLFVLLDYLDLVIRVVSPSQGVGPGEIWVERGRTPWAVKNILVTEIACTLVMGLNIVTLFGPVSVHSGKVRGNLGVV
jgi:hypothetical protein